MSKVTSYRGVDIVIRTRDEHCEPHVHAYHLGQGWELRIFFSYISDQIVEIDLLHGRAPGRSIVQTIMNKVIDHLDKIRELFWRAVHTVCLDNQFIFLVNGIAQAARQGTADAVQVRTAHYIPSTKSIALEIHGNTTLLVAKCP